MHPMASGLYLTRPNCARQAHKSWPVRLADRIHFQNLLAHKAVFRKSSDSRGDSLEFSSRSQQSPKFRSVLVKAFHPSRPILNQLNALKQLRGHLCESPESRNDRLLFED